MLHLRCLTGYRMCLCGWIQYSFQNSRGDISLAASKDGIILKIRSVNCLSIIRPLKQLSKVSAVSLSIIFVWYFFGKLLSKYLWRSSYKVHAFSKFFWTPLDGFVEVWELFFETYLILDVQTTFTLQEPHCKDFWWNCNKSEGCKSLQQRTKINISKCSSIRHAHWLWFLRAILLGSVEVNLSSLVIGGVQVNFDFNKDININGVTIWFSVWFICVIFKIKSDVQKINRC